MKLFSKIKENQLPLHGIMLSSIMIIFIASNYIVFAEIGPKLEWNISFSWFYALLILGFGVSWIYTGAINKEYKKVKAVLSESKSAEAAIQGKLKTLSRKEREVLHLILQGKSNQQICDELFISLSTLKSHINHIYHKMEVKRRQEIMALFG